MLILQTKPMNNYLHSIETLKNWWLTLDEDWKYFLCANYYFNCERFAFFDLADSILKGDFMDNWLYDDIVPSIIHHTVKTDKLIDVDIQYMSNDETGSFTFDIKTIKPVKDLINLKEVFISYRINDFDSQHLKELISLTTIKIDQKFVNELPEILMLNLPKLSKILIGVDPIRTHEDEYEQIRKIASKTRVLIKQYSNIDTDRAIFYI